MDTRVLTLFDDDDFFQAPEPKPVKPKAPKHKPAEDTPLAPEVMQEAPAQEINDESELDKQMKAEILAQDYTAFIHKDYPFDPGSAAVIIKDKEIYVPRVSEAAPKAEESPELGAVAEEEETGQDTEVATLPPFALEQKYYSIGEVAAMFKVNTSHIRFWTNEFKLKPRTTRKGGRLYLPEDIEQLRLIHHLVKEKRHTIKGAREKLKQGKNLVEQQLDLKTALEELRNRLTQIKEQL